jgi:hypothetical protein
MNYKTLRNVLCVTLLICMTFSAGITALADQSTAAADSKQVQNLVSSDGKQYLEDAVAKLVQEGKLSKEKANRILEYKQKMTEKLSRLTKEQKHMAKKEGKHYSMLGMLVNDRVITEVEANAIKAKLREMKDERLVDGMQGLVDKGVLTPKDIDNMRSYMLKERAERKAKIDKLKSMTPEERKAFFKSTKAERKDILTRMVEDKVITEKQAEEIKKAAPELSIPRSREPRLNNQQRQ